MIYKKDANFPYPILTNSSMSYASSEFNLDIELEENTDTYRFRISSNISSPFLSALVESGKAALILIVQSKDNKFFVLDPGQSYIEIQKSRISLNKRTALQLHLQAKEDISFRNNHDLDEFYTSFKDEIVVPKRSLLGFSNIVLFEGSNTNPLALFEKKLDERLSSDIKIELGPETIIIHYRDADLQFITLPQNQSLNNTYVYMGLRTALQQFIQNYAEEGEDLVELRNCVPGNGLDSKLYQLMTKKMVEEIGVDNIDEVIYQISDRIIEKFTSAVKGLAANGS
ncbi:hypothetical protein [Bacillus cereus]|uniref:hypothetical protein n=1 Tax=Bacillus cereus TaxID=1396 RepID=UPI000B49E497|nr:hypothetical protein [Bacillus cereus]